MAGQGRFLTFPKTRILSAFWEGQKEGEKKMSKNSSTVIKKDHKNHKLCQLILMLSVFVFVTAVFVLSVLHICYSDREISLYKGIMSADQNIHREMTAQNTDVKLTKKQAETLNLKFWMTGRYGTRRLPLNCFILPGKIRAMK